MYSHCTLKADVGQDPALLCLVVLKTGPFAWTVAQLFLQVQTSTLPLKAAGLLCFFLDFFNTYTSLPSLVFRGSRNAQKQLKGLDAYDNLLLFVNEKIGCSPWPNVQGMFNQRTGQLTIKVLVR